MATFGLLGCRNASAPGEPVPVAHCSDLARALRRAEGREVQVCGLDTTKAMRRELIPLGAGNVLEWLPHTGLYRRWAFGGDPPLPPTAGPLIPASDLDGDGRMLFGLGNNEILEVNAVGTDWKLFAAYPDPSFPKIIERQALHSFDVGWGREIVALDEGHVLRWTPGDGSYVLYRVDPAKAGNPFTAEPEYGGQQDDFFRGARLVNLGRHRLLTWMPREATYRIRRYRFDNGPEIFDPPSDDPPTEYPWSPLEATQQLLVIDDGKILKWDQADGSLEIDRYDLDAANPLAPGDPVAIARQDYGTDLVSMDQPLVVSSKIERMVLFLQQGRSFDSYFGQYCTAPFGSVPDCHGAPACCEAMPLQIPGASACAPIDPTDPHAHVPNDDPACLGQKIDNGYADTSSNPCADALDFACAGTGAAAGAIAKYHALAAGGALADRYFQSTRLGPESNFIYLGKTAFGVLIGDETGPELPELLANANVPLAFYTADPFSIPDKHNQPHPTFADAHWTAYRFPDEIERDVDRQQLGAISIVLFPPPYDESAADGPAAKGIDRVTGVIDRLLADGSPYRETTLIIVAFLTSGGYYDHVPPPPAFPENGPVSPVLYGPRLPFLVTGYFAKTNYVSHVPIELSSISAFGEWNWLGGVGQLHGRDERIAPIGDLIDSDRSHAIVPSAPPDGGGGP